jgi:hypothetical protein
MEDEVIIIEVEPKKFDIVDEPGKYSFKLDYFREVYSVNQPITHKPQFLAIREPKCDRIEYVFKIDPVCTVPILRRDRYFLRLNRLEQLFLSEKR